MDKQWVEARRAYGDRERPARTSASERQLESTVIVGLGSQHHSFRARGDDLGRGHGATRAFRQDTPAQPAHRRTVSRNIWGHRKRLRVRCTPVDSTGHRNRADFRTSVGKRAGQRKKQQQGRHGSDATHSPSQGDARRLLVRNATRVPGARASVPGGMLADVPRSTATS